jgi:hypothetical protein
MAFSKSSACISFIAASYAWIALAKCLDLERSGASARVEAVALAVPEVRRDSICEVFAGRRTDILEVGFKTRFLEPFAALDFAGFAFKRIDLAGADARPFSFLAVFDFDFALVAIRPQLIRLIAA